MVVHVPVKLGILTITFERKPKRFIYQLGNTRYSTYAAELVYLLLFHPLKLKDSHCEENMSYFNEKNPSLKNRYILFLSDTFSPKQSELRAWFC